MYEWGCLSLASKFKIACLTITLLLFCICLAATVTSDSSSYSTVSAKVAGSNDRLEIFTDSSCTQKLTSFSWGLLSAGSSATQTIYVKNSGSTNLMLSISTSNWSPSFANGPITLTWSGEKTLLPNQMAPITLKINVGSNATNIAAFNFNIKIVGSYTK
jgi:hypothetical protein